MALQSWSIASFPGADEYSETIELIDSGSDTVIVLSLLIANNSDVDDAEITVQRLSSADAVKFEWSLVIPQGNSPFALDSMFVVAGGDKLAVTSDIVDVSVDASGDVLVAE
jgi:hypothetical protein